MKTDLRMPLYIGDYLADTIGLSNSEHGSYILCLLAYWRNGQALTSNELREICGKDADRVCRFFVWEDNRWHHKRVDSELKIAWDNFSMKKSRAMKMVAARRAKGQI